MKKHTHAILLMVLCTIFTSTGQILWKLGFGWADFSVSLFSILNAPFIGGFISYGVGAVLMLTAFKKGELSVLYPIVATSYVWVTLASSLLFYEVVSPLKWVGIGIIVISVSALGIGGGSVE